MCEEGGEAMRREKWSWSRAGERRPGRQVSSGPAWDAWLASREQIRAHRKTMDRGQPNEPSGLTTRGAE